MKILQIGKYSIDSPGGMESAVLLLSQYLARNNHVEVFTSSLDNTERIIKQDNFTCYCLPTFLKLFSAPFSPKLFKKLKECNDFDIIQVSHPNPMAVFFYLLARPKGKLVVWYHSDIVKQWGLNLFFKFFMKVLLESASAIVVTSKAYIECSKELKNFRDKITVIPYGIDINKFNNINNNAALALREKIGAPIVLFIGRFTYYKGISYLIKAMIGINAKLLIIGQGELGKKIKRLVSDYGLSERIIFEQNVMIQLSPEYIQACDVLVLPSINRAEAFGMVLLEAMACAKPIVTTELGTGTSYVCQDGVNGFVVPLKNISALQSAINKIIFDKNLSEKLGNSGRLMVKESFTIEKMGESFLRLYKIITKEHEKNI